MKGHKRRGIGVSTAVRRTCGAVPGGSARVRRRGIREHMLHEAAVSRYMTESEVARRRYAEGVFFVNLAVIVVAAGAALIALFVL